MKIRNIYDFVYGSALVSYGTGDCETCPKTTNLRVNCICKIKEWAEGIFTIDTTTATGQITESDVHRTFEKFDTMYGEATVSPFYNYVYLKAIGLISEVVDNKTRDMYSVGIGQITDNVPSPYYYQITSKCVGQITELVTSALYWDVGFIKRGPYVGSWEKE